MIDLKFIKFYVESIHNKSIEEYFHVERPTVSNWRRRGMPKRYLLTFIDMEKSDNIFDLFERIYPKNKKEMIEESKKEIELSNFEKLESDLLGQHLRIDNGIEIFRRGSSIIIRRYSPDIVCGNSSSNPPFTNNDVQIEIKNTDIDYNFFNNILNSLNI